MRLPLTLVLVVVSIALIAVVILQQNGTGLGSSFGGSGESYRSKRGVEKIIQYATIALVVLFAVLSVALLALP